MIVGAIVFVACLLGTLSRPLEFLASFWPADALMLGLILRFPHLGRSVWTWVWAALAYVVSAVMMGDPPVQAVWLSIANLASVVAGWNFFLGVERNTVMMRGSLSALFLLCGCLTAATAGAIVGFGTGPVLFGRQPLESLFMWFTGELMSYMLVLPVVLCFPCWKSTQAATQRKSRVAIDAKTPRYLHAAPLLALVLSEIAAYALGGPGALVFSVPALLWCALRYTLGTVASLCLVVGLLKAFTFSLGLTAYTPDHLVDVISLRIGITLFSLGPLALASAQYMRNELLAKLQYVANYDGLTSLLGRTKFTETATRWLQRQAHERGAVAVLMLDLDHFKQINDEYNHAGGDAVLKGFGELLIKQLRPSDVAGRMGGEEFAVLLPNVTRQEAVLVAQRLCDHVRGHTFLPTAATDSAAAAAPTLRVTVSIGVVHQPAPPAYATIDQLLREADHALYDAKKQGRDRVVIRADAPYCIDLHDSEHAALN